MSLSLSSESAEDTFKIGAELGSLLRGDELILLFGELGAGKTVFTKGIGSSMGIDPSDIVSPTFTLMNIYRGKRKLFHLDLYRIGKGMTGGVPEIDDNLGTGLIIVEWAQYLDPVYLKEERVIRIDLNLPSEESDIRDIVIHSDCPDIKKGNFSF